MSCSPVLLLPTYTMMHLVNYWKVFYPVSSSRMVLVIINRIESSWKAFVPFLWVVKMKKMLSCKTLNVKIVMKVIYLLIIIVKIKIKTMLVRKIKTILAEKIKTILVKKVKTMLVLKVKTMLMGMVKY